MMETDWKIIVAIAVAAVLQSVAYAIREWSNGRARARFENKLDGNTALTATSLVSSGTLPHAAPCIPTVAQAISGGTASSSKSAVEYATTAVCVARETMTREGIPVQNQELLLVKMKKMLDETADKEERHSKNNAAFIQVLNEEIDRLKAEVAAVRGNPSS